VEDNDILLLHRETGELSAQPTEGASGRRTHAIPNFNKLNARYPAARSRYAINTQPPGRSTSMGLNRAL